jgi:sugar/nucleoside kinase (ribokinase family)
LIDAVVAGHLCVDIIPQIPGASAESDSFLAPGRLTEVGAALLSPGGSVSNTGIALHKLGLDARLVGLVGDDLVGKLTRDVIRAHGRELVQGLAVRADEPSSYTVVISPPGVDRTFLHCAGPNDAFGPEDVPGNLLARARLFHFGYPPVMRRMYADGGFSMSSMFRQAKETGVTTSLDMAMPDPTRPSGQADWRAILGLSLPYVDVFLPSAEELLYMLQRERFEQLGRRADAVGMLDALTPAEVSALGEEALSMGAKMVVMKLGHRGIYLRTTRSLSEMGHGAPADASAWAARELWAPCFKVHMVGTVGAGDAAIAGFLTGLLKGQLPGEAATSAAAVGACNVEAADATSGIRGWRETQDRVRAGWERLDPRIDSTGWVWDEESSLWRGPRDG